MPLFKTLSVSETTKVIIWKIEETIEELQKHISLSDYSKQRLESMKSELRQKEFLSIRNILKEFNIQDSDLQYDEYGKPHLKDGRFISMTHSFQFTGVIVSEEKSVGIDIEKQREKIFKIANKFTPIEEYKTIANVATLTRKLTIVWGGKESLYKIYGEKKLLFLHHIFIEDFNFEDEKTTGTIRFEGTETNYDIEFLEFEDFTCVYAY